MGADQSCITQKVDLLQDGQNYISFFVNGKEYNVNVEGFGPEFGPSYVLVDFLRDKIGLTGTKTMCRAGGCGACTIMVKSLHPKSGQTVTRSANSCLMPLYACDGLDITTIEGIGNLKDGYHPIQERLVKFGGTQCGMCSPGLVMNMYSYAQVNPDFTGGNVEYSLDGNICRCTGYRSIMDAFKSLSKNASEELRRKCIDIEECYKCPMSGGNEAIICESSDSTTQLEIINPPRKLHLRNRFSGGEEWIKVTSLPTLYEVLQRLSYVQKKYRLVAGNTGAGVFKNDGPYSTYVDISDVPELHEVSVDKSGMVLGGCTSLTEAIDQFMDVAKTGEFVYAAEFAKHFRRIASLTVRNYATLAGNLMLKRYHPEFTSDIFVLFESVGATLRIGSSTTLYRNYTLSEFLSADMTGQVIISIRLPIFGPNHIFRCFKIAKRYQNSQADVNAGILFNIDKRNRFKVLSKPSICFGGISPTFTRANSTEEYFTGKYLDSSTMRGALRSLERETVPNENPLLPSSAHRLGLAQSLLYKYILGILRNTVNPTVRTGADDVDRGLNTGVQTYEADKSKFPLYQPIPKLESFPQVSGQAEFINDMQIGLNELFGAFVLTTVANAIVSNIDASHALQSPGVVAFVTAKDIPGSNNHAVFGSLQEEIFVTNKVHYCGQPVGLLVAKTREAAFQARDKVIIKYQNIKKPTLDIRESVKQQIVSKKKVSANLAFPCRGINQKVANDILRNMKEKEMRLRTEGGNLVGENMYSVKGEFITRGQYHFHMETQTCLCIPREDGMDIYSSTQSMDNVQAAIAAALNKPSNSINVAVRRIGGGFGAKSSKANHIATACAVASHVTSKPVRVVLDLETNMRMIGKRLPYLTKYEATVDDTGKIHKLTAKVFCDAGSIPNEPSSLFFTICMQSCYQAEQWDLTPEVALTDTAPNTYCRSPGSAQAIASVENIMEHIAHIVGKDPLEVRRTNFIQKGDPLVGIPGAKLKTANPLPGMINELKNTSDYVSRRTLVDTFNKANRWRKRGISIVPQRMPIPYADYRLPTFISVYHVDGTVSVSHGGIEMGQGINTKVAQVVAYTLNIPLDNVIVKPTNSTISPNTAYTAGSVTSEMVCHSAQKACTNLLEKMEIVREQLENPTWQELVAACNAKGILLTAQHQDVAGDIVSYDVWGATVIEVEVDVLTGDYRIIRADIIEDAGSSLSPLLDIGQIEGAFIMGLGWLLTENLVYDKETGELLTDNTWHYKPFLPADISEDLRVTMLRNSPNPFGVLSSKATAEPPLNMSVSVMFALRNAIDSARRDAGNFEWYSMDAPVSREDIRRLALTSTEQFIL